MNIRCWLPRRRKDAGKKLTDHKKLNNGQTMKRTKEELAIFMKMVANCGRLNYN